MAHDWIKMRIGLEDDPAVIFIGKLTKLEPDHVCGKLLNLWGWADQNSTDGRLNGVSPEWIDKRVGKRGFAKAMAQVQPPWLLIDETGVTIPNFERHNGASAKRRMCDTERKRLSRNHCDNLRTTCGQKRDQRREEKRREDIPPPLPPSKPKPEAASVPSPWEGVGRELDSEGLRTTREVLAAAERAGCSPEHVRALLEHWRSRQPAWGLGALGWRIENARPDQDPDTGWPDPSPESIRERSREETNRNAVALHAKFERQKAEAAESAKREAEREAAYGPMIDALDIEEQKQLIRQHCDEGEAKLLLKMFRNGKPGNHARSRLIEIASELAGVDSG